MQPMIQWAGYELILGSSTDPQFGPVLLFGMGGQFVEVFKDRALATPSLEHHPGRRLMEGAPKYIRPQGRARARARGPRGLELLLVRFSQLVVEQRLMKEIDINPLLASPDRLLALDARVLLHEFRT